MICPAVPGFAEVNAINRQKFLAELAKLLTFMYEEDRLRALSMYERMFDITEDEQGLIQHLMSPTRQAVIIARAYDAKERKLSVSTQSRGDTVEETETPKFVLAINKIFDDLFPEAEDLPEADQVSFFDLGLAEKEDFSPAKPAVPPGAVLLSDTQKFHLDPAAVPEEGSADGTAPASDEAVPAGSSSAHAEEAEGEIPDYLADGASIDALISSLKKDFAADLVTEEPPEPVQQASPEETNPADSDAPEEQPGDVPVEGNSPEMEVPLDGAPEPKEDVSPADLSAPDSPEDLPSEEEPEEPAAPVVSPEDSTADTAVSAPDELAAPEDDKAAAPAPAKKTYRRETSTLKLVPFLVIAVPVTIVLLALLLVPTLLFFALAAGLISLGATLAVSAFSGIAVLADLLLLVGSALVAFALGLLFLWLGIWVIGSGMVGLVHSVRNLSLRLCTKEVPVE